MRDEYVTFHSDDSNFSVVFFFSGRWTYFWNDNDVPILGKCIYAWDVRDGEIVWRMDNWPGDQDYIPWKSSPPSLLRGVHEKLLRHLLDDTFEEVFFS
jgi:hypothetical protein